jgi:ribulose 1,5-bisphosphate carboxylase large subunit-like protein
MQTVISWVDRDKDAPTLEVAHNPHNTELSKRLTFSVGNEMVIINTNAEGLLNIQEAVNNHEQKLRLAAEMRLKAAIEEAKAFGVTP